MSALSPARRAALKILTDADRTGAFARDLAHSIDPAADRRDAAFAMRLALGVTATRGCLDELLDRFLQKPGSVKPTVRQALRISAFELVYLGTAPNVAVSQGVELVKSRARYAAGLANAVLHRVADARNGYLSCGDEAVSRSRTAGLPVWLYRAIEDSLGADRALELCRTELERAPIALFCAPGAGDQALGDASSAFPGNRCGVDIARGEARSLVGEDLAVASDLNAQLIAAVATDEGSCLEIGCGRGTKTFIMAALARHLGLDRECVAVDLSQGKCRLNLERLERAGLDGATRFAWGDARELDRCEGDDGPLGQSLGGGRFDTVFLDAPCSGTGTMRRHPEIPWRLSAQDVECDLPELQLQLLAEASRRVGEGGSLVYATCSVMRAENRGVIEAFLASDEGRGFELVPVSDAPALACDGMERARELLRAGESDDGLFQSSPAPDGYDGHFCARFKRISA